MCAWILTGQLVIKQMLPQHWECAQQTPQTMPQVFPWSLPTGSKEKSRYGSDILGERPATLSDGPASMAVVWPIFLPLILQGMCVVHNFKGTPESTSKPKPEDPRGVPLMAFPRIESPLETLSAQV